MKGSAGGSGGLKNEKEDDKKEQQSKPKDVGICRFRRLGDEGNQQRKGERTDKTKGGESTNDAESNQFEFSTITNEKGFQGS